jgi:hypothetical protein
LGDPTVSLMTWTRLTWKQVELVNVELDALGDELLLEEEAEPSYLQDISVPNTNLPDSKEAAAQEAQVL